MAHRETILVTGASGFIGGWLVETLYLQGCADVRAGIRSWSSAARLARFPVRIVLCDVMNAEQTTQAMSGVSCVIHCAKGPGKVTVEGTRNALDAALRLGVNRFVHLSSAEVYGDVSGKVDESFPLQQAGNQYGESKVEAERLCWQYQQMGLPITVIRPSIVYGPFSKTWTVDLARNLQSGMWRVLKGSADGICNLVYISDLVSGILLAARHEKAAGEAFNLSGPEAITWNEYFQKFNAALGLPELRPMDSTSVKLRAALMEPARSSIKLALKHFERPIRQTAQRSRHAKRLMRYFEQRIKTTPRPEDLSLYDRGALYVTAKAQDMLDYTPAYDVERGLEMCVRWLDHVGLAGQAA